MYIEQAKLGKKIACSLLPHEKIQNIGYPSEVDVPNYESVSKLQKIWEMLILGDTRIKQKIQQDYFSWELSQEMEFPVILSRRKIEYRNYFHKYLRGEATDQEVIRSLQADASRFSQSIGYLARIDLESPLFNEVVYPDGSSTGPRIDLWKKLHDTYENSPNLFISISDLLQQIKHVAITKHIIEHSPTEDSKWQFDKYKILISEAGKQVVQNSFLWYVWLSTHHSDYFCTEKNNWYFKTHDGGKIEIVKKQTFREPELQAKLELLSFNDYNAVSGEVSDYMEKVKVVYSTLSSGAT